MVVLRQFWHPPLIYLDARACRVTYGVFAKAKLTLRTSGGKLHEVGSHGCSDENREDKEHKGKKTIERRRRRKP